MKKISVSDIKGIRVGTSTTFHLESCVAVFNAASLASHVQSKYKEEGVRYSCTKDTANNSITIEAKKA